MFVLSFLSVVVVAVAVPVPVAVAAAVAVLVAAAAALSELGTHVLTFCPHVFKTTSPERTFWETMGT